MTKKSPNLLFCFFILLFGIATGRHVFYVYSLEPMVREAYNNIWLMPKRGHWIKDATSYAEKYFPLGLNDEEAKKIILEQGLKISSYTHRNRSEIEKYDYRIVGYTDLRWGFAGVGALLFASYTYRVILNFNDHKLENVQAVVAEHSL